MGSLEFLNLSYCSKLKIPEFGEGMEKLSFLRIACIATKELPSSIEHLVGLQELYMFGCPKLKKLLENRGETECLKPSIRKPSQQGTSSNLEFFRLTTVNCFGLIDNEGFTNGIFWMLRRLAAQGISPDFLLYTYTSDLSYSYNRRPSFDIVSPGSRISEWFDIRSEGDSLTVELPPDRKNCKSEWMGFVFCVVFAHLKEPHTLEYDQFVIEGLLPEFVVKHIRDSEKYFTLPRHVKGDHLWVYFMSLGQIQDTTSCSFTVSFDGYCESWRRPLPRIPCPNCVKRCGARLLYEDDLKNLLNPPTDIMKRSLELCDSKGGRSKRRRGYPCCYDLPSDLASVVFPKVAIQFLGGASLELHNAFEIFTAEHEFCMVIREGAPTL
ncbi:hypothetical protein ACLB2K_061020 [Fragaria x ananassa]